MTTRCSAFTLLEMAITLLILGLLAGGLLTRQTQTARRDKQEALRAQFDAIEASLMAYRSANGRLPCPADGTFNTTITYFGVEAATPGTCTGGTPAANFNDGSNTVGGVLPVRTLNLPDETMFDPWGGGITYVVDKRITAASAFTTYSVTNTTIGSVSVYDGSAYPAASGNARTAKAIALFISHGPNGHGAFQRGGLRKSAAATNSDELQNCHCDAATTASTFNATFVQHAATASATSALNSFDDTLRYYLRSGMLSGTDYTR